MVSKKLMTCASSLCLLFAASGAMGKGNELSNSAQTNVTHTIKKKSNRKTNKKIKKKSSDHDFFSSLKSRIHIYGFASAGIAKTDTSANYNIPQQGAINQELNYMANSIIGVQATVDITKTFSAVVQLVANGNDINGNKPYHVKADWAFLRYKPISGLQLRAGRFRIPAFMYSATQEIGYTYPWVTLPNEVYRIVPFNNMNGFDMIYSLPLGSSGWQVKFQPYIGESKSQYDLYTNLPSIIPPGTTATFDENDLIGGVVSVSNQHLTLRGNYTRVDLNGYIPGLPTVNGQRYSLLHNATASFYSFGAKFNYHHFLAMGEYAHRSTPNRLAALTGYYGMVGYRIGKFLPNLTYAHIDTTNTHALITTPGAELPEAQKSYTLGLDYYINSHFVAKVGVSQITPLDGTNGLFNAPVGRKHVYLYSASLSAIF